MTVPRRLRPRTRNARWLIPAGVAAAITLPCVLPLQLPGPDSAEVAQVEQDVLNRLRAETVARSQSKPLPQQYIQATQRQAALEQAREAAVRAEQAQASTSRATSVDPNKVAMFEEAAAKLAQALENAPPVVIAPAAAPEVVTGTSMDSSTVTPGTQTSSAPASAEVLAVPVPASTVVVPAAYVVDPTITVDLHGFLIRDAEVSASITAAARAVIEASAALETATAEALVAEEAARAAAEAAAVELARKVALAQASPNGQLPDDALCRVSFAPGHRLRCDAAEALERLNVAWRADHGGADLRMTDSYRTLALQVDVKERKPDLAATPGRSNHGSGQAIDLVNFGGVGQFDAPDYLWMKAHAGQYGWHHPAGMEPGGGGPYEPWHWEFGTA